MLAGMLLAVLLLYQVGHSSAQCPGGCSCPTRGGNTRLACSGGGFTEIPNFPATFRQTATVLYVPTASSYITCQLSRYDCSSSELANNLITTIRATDLQGFVSLERL